MTPEQARQQIKHHEAAAQRHSGAKRQQHIEAMRYLREKYDIPEPEPIVHSITSINREAQHTEAERIRQWKESR